MSITGRGLRKVLLVGEADWTNKHYMVDRLISRGSLDREAFYFTTANTPSLLTAAKAHGVKVIVPMGEVALNKVTHESNILRWRGRVIEWFDGIFVVPTFAPHKLLPENPNAQDAHHRPWTRNPPRFQGTWVWDIQRALSVAEHGFTRKRVNYLIDPPVNIFAQWVNGYFDALAQDPEILLSFDIETPYKQKKGDEGEFEEADFDTTILRISFAYRECAAVTVPWTGPYLPLVDRLLRSPGGKVVWNGSTFDVPVIESVEGFAVLGQIYDYMDGWHFYQSDLDKGLEPVTSFTSDLLPWKHLANSDPGTYSCVDSDAALRNAHWIRDALQRTGQWPTFLNHYVRLMPILYEAGRRGNYIDLDKRNDLEARLQVVYDDLLTKSQDMVPRELRPRTDFRKKLPEGTVTKGEDVAFVEHEGYLREFDISLAQEEGKVCSVCGEPAPNKTLHYKGGKKNPCHGGTQIIQVINIPVYYEVLPFNPKSSEQLKAYARFHKHPIGTDPRDNTKETMDATHLKALVRQYGAKHPLYALALELSKVSKTKGTYVYNPDGEGLIHTTYKNAPSTPRFSSVNVNLQNVGKREENVWATEARQQIVARPGHRFVQADSSAIEAVIQGWWMGDADYMRIATQSVHAWLCCQHLGWEFTPENVSKVKSEQKDLYNKLKTVNYLTNFGGGPNLIFRTQPETFPTRKAAEETQELLYTLLPTLRQYHHWVRAKAQKESYLELPWKHRHYFYDVFSTDAKTGKLRYGHDAKRVCAFFPQGCAAAFMRDNVLLLGYGQQAVEWLGIEPLDIRPVREWMPANLVVHDGYTLECPDGAENEAAYILEQILTRPIPQLGNIRIGCEIDISPVGGNWGSYHPKKNPKGLKTVKTVKVEVGAPRKL